MINLIPNEEKKKMIRDFYLRFLVMFFVILGCVMLVSFAVLIPSYILSSLNKNVANEKLVALKTGPKLDIDPATASTIADLESKLVLVEKAKKNQYLLSENVIKKILSKRVSDITLTQISYENNSELGKKITIAGIARNRESLLAFRKALGDDPAFKSVDLPISNFTKVLNIPFDVTLIPS